MASFNLVRLLEISDDQWELWIALGNTFPCICYGPYQNSVSINTARAVLILTEGPVSIDAARAVLMLTGKPVSINTDRFARAVLILPTFSL